MPNDDGTLLDSSFCDICPLPGGVRLGLRVRVSMADGDLETLGVLHNPGAENYGSSWREGEVLHVVDAEVVSPIITCV